MLFSVSYGDIYEGAILWTMEQKQEEIPHLVCYSSGCIMLVGFLTIPLFLFLQDDDADESTAPAGFDFLGYEILYICFFSEFVCWFPTSGIRTFKRLSA